MKQLSNLFLVSISLVIISCADNYYTGDFSEQNLIGKWRLVQSPRPLGTNKEWYGTGGSIIVFKDNKKFEALSTPIVDSINDVTFVNDHGSWVLEEEIDNDYQFRWKLRLSFENTNRGVTWHLIKQGNEILLNNVYNLDTSSGFLYKKSLDNSNQVQSPRMYED